MHTPHFPPPPAYRLARALTPALAALALTSGAALANQGGEWNEEGHYRFCIDSRCYIGRAPDYNVTIDEDTEEVVGNFGGYPFYDDAAFCYTVNFSYGKLCPPLGNGHVTVNGGTVGRVIGGFLADVGATRGNTVIINGGTVEEVAGAVAVRGYADSTDVHDATIILNGGTVGSLICSSAWGWGHDASSTVVVGGKNIRVGSLRSCGGIEFVLPEGFGKDDAALIITGGNSGTAFDVGQFGRNDRRDGPPITISGNIPPLALGESITLVRGNVTGSVRDDYFYYRNSWFQLEVKDGNLVATVVKEGFPITVTSGHGSAITCSPAWAVKGENVDIRCDVTQPSDDGYELTGASLDGGSCNVSGDSSISCSAENVTGPLVVQATWTSSDSGSGGGSDDAGAGSDDDPGAGSDSGRRRRHSAPAVGELGLLLSGIALAGAAAPALRRREKRGKKADTRQ